ncbi:MAG: hypothetical protein AAFP90_01465 [Planctomycetota bacterium]
MKNQRLLKTAGMALAVLGFVGFATNAQSSHAQMGGGAMPAAGAGGDSSTGAAIAYPSQNFSWLDHASTISESHNRGVAAVIQASGEANYYHSLAAINYEVAIDKRIENRTKALEHRYKRQDMYLAKLKDRSQRLDSDKHQAMMMKYAPERLSEGEGMRDGMIVWPYPLDSNVFTQHTTNLQRLLASRTPENTGRDTRLSALVRRSIAEIKLMLDRHSNIITVGEYVAADDFLQRVEWEAMHPPKNPQPAAPKPKKDDQTLTAFHWR